jgi:hypothetical protein
MNAPRARIKPGRASLIGGMAVAAASFILWAAIAHEMKTDTAVVLVLGALVAGGIGTWIRVADL